MVGVALAVMVADGPPSQPGDMKAARLGAPLKVARGREPGESNPALGFEEFLKIFGIW